MGTKATAKKEPAAQARSLLEYAHAKRLEERRKACAICRLPDDIRADLRRAPGKKIDVQTRLGWLKSLGFEITELDFKAHSSIHDALNEQKAVTP